MKKIYVVPTMDVEPLKGDTHPTATGPETWEQSEKFIRGYAEQADKYGYPVSYFIHPEVAVAQSVLFEELNKNGHCVDCLHLHPWKFRDGKYKAHFGDLTENDMRASLAESISMWQSGFGRRPLYFRPGTFSANDMMYKVLVDLGFRGGSCSMPGRVWPRMKAIWTGAAPDPHRPHATFRQAVGDLEFGNMPNSADFSTLAVAKGSNFQMVEGEVSSTDENTVTCHRDLRPDWRDNDYHAVANNIVEQLIERDPSIPVMTWNTHNDNDHTDPEDRVSKNLRIMLKEITDACKSRGIEPVGATMADICDMVLAEPVKMSPFVYT